MALWNAGQSAAAHPDLRPWLQEHGSALHSAATARPPPAAMMLSRTWLAWSRAMTASPRVRSKPWWVTRAMLLSCLARTRSAMPSSQCPAVMLVQDLVGCSDSMALARPSASLAHAWTIHTLDFALHSMCERNREQGLGDASSHRAGLFLTACRDARGRDLDQYKF